MVVFDGRKYAKEVETGLLLRVRTIFKKLGRGPKLVAIVDPDNEAGVKYVELKRRMAERLGIGFKIYELRLKEGAEEAIKLANVDEEVDGIMLQMPFPGSEELVSLVDPGKDVDGLREDSGFMPATIRAVREILSHELGISDYGGVTVVGSRGVVGRGLLKWLPKAVGMDKDDFDPSALLRASVVISATGQEGLIRPEMVKEGVITIDVGYPKGDFDPEVAKKASFFTPVPGGVGPVTVVMLFANLAEAITFSGTIRGGGSASRGGER